MLVADHLRLHADSVDKETAKNHVTLSNYLSYATKDDNEKVIIFSYWIAKNIRYDLAETKWLKRSNKTANEVLRNKKAVCEGYANLLKQLCDNQNILCYIIDGHAYGGLIKRIFNNAHMRHSWNAVYVNSEWKLIDVTWSEQEAKSATFKKKSVLTWVYADPENFAKTHLPRDTRWQMQENPLSSREFWRQKPPAEKNYAFSDSLGILLTRDVADSRLISLKCEYLDRENPRKYVENLIFLGWDYVGGYFDSTKIQKGVDIFRFTENELENLNILFREKKISQSISTGISTGEKRLQIQQ